MRDENASEIGPNGPDDEKCICSCYRYRTVLFLLAQLSRAVRLIFPCLNEEKKTERDHRRIGPSRKLGLDHIGVLDGF